MFLLYLLATASFSAGEYYAGDKYFSVDDRLRADCIVLDGNYQYLGNRSKDINNEDCASWIKVFNSQPSLALLHPGEISLHRKCRSLPLAGNAIKRGERGPWCYIKKNDGSYNSSACFPECQGSGTKRRERKPKSYGRTYGLNYNQGTIDHIERFFHSYKWGPEKYYVENPSDSILSAEYYRIFISCIGVLILILVYILGCYCLKRKADNTRRHRELAIKEIFNEDHNTIPTIISRPAPN